MLYGSEISNRPYDAYIQRARTERARVTLGLLARAATGLRVLVGLAAREGRGLIARWAEARRSRAAILELQSLDERMLKDIGITRSQIRAFVYGVQDADRRRREPGTLRLVTDNTTDRGVATDGRRKAA